METIRTAITGEEMYDGGTRPFDALAEFYRAFNRRDLALMEANWLPGEAAAMSNPLGGIVRGWPAIRGVYQRIFFGRAEVRVEYHDYTIFEGDGFFQAVGRERGHFAVDDRIVELAIRTSRLFVLHDGRYRQLHHHGSIDDAALLAAYQEAAVTTADARAV